MGPLVVGVGNAIGLVPWPFSNAAKKRNHSQKIHEDCNGEGFTASIRVRVAPHLDKLNDDKHKIASHVAGMVDMVEGLSVVINQYSHLAIGQEMERELHFTVFLKKNATLDGE